MKKHISPFLLLIAALIWGFAFVAQKAASEIPPFALGATRTAIAVPVIALVVIFFDKASKNGRKLFSVAQGKFHIDVNRAELFGGLVCGAFLFTAISLQQAGLHDGTDAGKAAFISALYVVIVPLLALVIRRPSPITAWISIAIAMVGFYLLCVKNDFSIELSDITILLCTLAFAAQIIAVDIFLPKADGCRLSLIQFSTVSLLSAIAALIFEGASAFSGVVLCLPEVLYLGILSSGIAYTLQILGQKHTHPAIASAVLSLESVFGAIAGAMVLNEKMSAREYVGCAVVFAAVILSQLDLKAIFGEKKEKNVEN